MTTRVQAEARHCLSLGLSLCWIGPRRKGPTDPQWQRHPITTRAELDRRLGPTDNFGIIHAASGTGALDVDDLPAARAALATYGVDLDQLLGGGLRLSSGRPDRAKLFFRVPAGREFGRKVIQVPETRQCAVEFRGGDVQDVGPGSVHPEGTVYRWEPGRPATRESIPMIPDSLLRIWRELLTEGAQITKDSDLGLTQRPAADAAAGGESVIEAFNRTYSLAAILQQHGYRRRGKRWLAPSSTTGMAGIVQLERGVFSHHGSDPLAIGHCVDAFDAFRILDHGGDLRGAVRAAAELLGVTHAPGSAGPTKERLSIDSLSVGISDEDAANWIDRKAATARRLAARYVG
ncbi:MAG: bifunctional DNA primase/polymerase [Gemmatimonadales bacterium]